MISGNLMEWKLSKTMRIQLIPLLALSPGPSVPTDTHMWDELTIMVRSNNAGGFILEKYCLIQSSTYTNGVLFDYDNGSNPDMLSSTRGGY